MELIHSKCQDSSYINILLVKKLLMKVNGDTENILRINHAVLTIENLISEISIELPLDT